MASALALWYSHWSCKCPLQVLFWPFSQFDWWMTYPLFCRTLQSLPFWAESSNFHRSFTHRVRELVFPSPWETWLILQCGGCCEASTLRLDSWRDCTCWVLARKLFRKQLSRWLSILFLSACNCQESSAWSKSCICLGRVSSSFQPLRHLWNLPSRPLVFWIPGSSSSHKWCCIFWGQPTT